MKIKYVHCSEPEVKKVYDTVVALKNNPSVHMPQEEFDKMELAHLERDKEKGYILFYEKIFEWPELTSGLIIHCDTETEAKMLMYIAEEQGYVWSVCRETPTAHTYFHMHQEETCYRFQTTESGNKYISYADKDCYKEKEFPIVEFDKFFFGVSYEEMQEYGYDWEGMYGMSAERAASLYDELDKTFYKLYDHDNSEAEIDGKEDFKTFDGLFGVEQVAFASYVRDLYKDKERDEEREA